MMKMESMARVLDMNGNEFNLEVHNGRKRIKLRKDGERKRTPNNNRRDRWVDPIRNREDIEKIKVYLQEKIDNETNIVYRRAYGRNKLLFIMGINLGLRVSDLLKIKWKDIFLADMKTFRSRRGIGEKKTGKTRQLYFNESVQNAVMDYINQFQPDLESEEYVFVNSKRAKDGKFHVISDECVSKMIKDATSKCGVEGNYSTHSLRKTFAYQMYLLLVEKNDLLALPKVQKFLNHRNQSDTLQYLGLQYDMEQEINDELNL